MRQRNNLLHFQEDDNPLGMLANLFDVAMVFAVALMVAIVSHFNMNEIFSKEDYTIIKQAGTGEMEIITKKGTEIKHYAASDNQEQNGMPGRRVGSAYELESGEIVYIPE